MSIKMIVLPPISALFIILPVLGLFTSLATRKYIDMLYSTMYMPGKVFCKIPLFFDGKCRKKGGKATHHRATFDLQALAAGRYSIVSGS